jgi:hypothetical protein
MRGLAPGKTAGTPTAPNPVSVAVRRPDVDYWSVQGVQSWIFQGIVKSYRMM